MKFRLVGLMGVGILAFAVTACDRGRDQDREMNEPLGAGEAEEGRAAPDRPGAIGEQPGRVGEQAPLGEQAPQRAERLPGEQVQPVAGADKAEVELDTAENVDIEARSQLFASNDGVRVVVEVENGQPNAVHGVHIHEKPDCSDIPGKSMGEHFAPEGKQHALPEQPVEQRHLGDLGNIQLDKDGKGRLELTVPNANLTPGDRLSFTNRAIVIHSGRDVGKQAQPSGDSGAPIACGVIEKSD